MGPCWPKGTEVMTHDTPGRRSGLMDAGEAVGYSSEKLYRIGDEINVN